MATSGDATYKLLRNHLAWIAVPALDARTVRFATLAYYVATALFLLLDLGFDLNVRVAFLEPYPGWRLVYYGVCFACLGIMFWRPAWTALVSAVESLATIVALIMSLAVKSMLLGAAPLDDGASVVTSEEIVNFLISGSFAYLGWTRGMQQLRGFL